MNVLQNVFPYEVFLSVHLNPFEGSSYIYENIETKTKLLNIKFILNTAVVIHFKEEQQLTVID